MRQVLFGILSVISANPGINQSNVGRALGIQRANMVALATELIERGWVARSVHSDDRRSFVLDLTEAGAEALTDTLAHIRRHEGRVLRDLSRSERQTLMALLSRLTARDGSTDAT